MTVTITTRLTKGSQLTHTEVDANFTDLQDAVNVAKMETITITGATYTASTKRVILADATAASIVIDLPDATTSLDIVYYVKKIDSTANTVTADPSGSQTVDGASTSVLSAQWDVIRIISDGVQWLLI